MAHRLTNHGDRSTDYLSTLHANSSSPDEFKSSYDDLIDQYAEPYSRISATIDSRGPSHSLDQKTPYTILPDSWACRLFVITATLLVRLQDEGNAASESAKKMPVYLTIFALAHVFQLVLALDAVYARNTLQFICLMGNTEPWRRLPMGPIHIPVHVLTDIIPGVISGAELAYIALGWKIYKEFGWKVYKFLGADRRIKKMYASYQIFQCLVKFDLFFWIGFTYWQKSDWEYYVTLAALPLSVILLIEGHLAARYENKWMMATFMSGCIGALVYFIYKVLKYRNTDYAAVWHSLTTFSAIAIFLLLITIVFTIIVMRNFGRGLKDSIAKNANHARTGSQPFHRGPMSMNPNRMSIE
ncbi:hypothetical protein EDD16DRAFT_1688925 [Pisolithus croceorrhizus]|nr:hypothetical protein EDD16DRAFT_1688925 [Pisolithus croceorrhizus]